MTHITQGLNLIDQFSCISLVPSCIVTAGTNFAVTGGGIY